MFAFSSNNRSKESSDSRLRRGVSISPPKAKQSFNRLKFFAMFLRHLVPWQSTDIHGKVYGNRPRGTPLSKGLNARGVAKYSDFGSLEGYISQTAQDRSLVPET